ncbi:MAG: phosphoenolpyruvate--protein phosphotransferase [Chitinispirillales bacterium]|jgi:phosphotransferase system enzyme I (PtsI)|nr:phosphoenolpyruvate--protein phosphotransferase [Chitinispirillales bacterium]
MQSKSKIHAGISIVSGKGYGKAVIIHADPCSFTVMKIEQKMVKDEIKRFENARNKANKYYDDYTKTNVISSGKDSDVSIIEMYKYIVNDKTLTKQVLYNISNEYYTAESAVRIVMENIIETFKVTDSEYFKERGKDVEEVRNKILFYLTGDGEKSNTPFKEDVVLIIKRSLLLSDIIGNNVEKIKAIVCTSSGKTSHAVIVARSNSIPVMAISDFTTLNIDDGIEVFVDCDAGTLTIEPSDNILDIYYTYVNEIKLQKRKLSDYLNKPVFTRDGIMVLVMANVSLESDVSLALNNGADGIGLVRTEILFNKNFDFPTESDQIKYYNAIFDNVEKSKNICIRVIDIGGDKIFNYMDVYEEENPFMGCRSVRIYREKRELFEVQIKAILKAGKGRKYRIMYPMITTFSEWNELRTFTKEIAEDLGLECPELGVLFEVPLAILEISTFLDTISFASIGTNDLIQYLSAADRGNAKVNYLYNPIEPAFLKIIKTAIDECNLKGKPVSLCGDMASHPEFTILLLGLGLLNFSVAPPMIQIIKEIIVSVSIAEIKEETNHMLSNLKSTEIVAEWIDYMNDKYCKLVFSKYNFIPRTKEL